MDINKEQLKDILVSGGYLDESDWNKAESESKKSNSYVLDYLMERGMLSGDVFGQAVAEFLGLSYADLNSNMPEKEQILKIPEDVATKYRLVLFKSGPKSLILATDNPQNPELSEFLKEKFKDFKVKLAYSLTEDIDAAFLVYRKALETKFSEIIKEKHRIAPEIVDEIFSDAISYRASDIHFEPEEKEVIIRFRIDGVMEEAGRLPKEFYEGILNRIKIKSKLRTDEHFATQDGSMSYSRDGMGADMRVSIAPILDGEKVVIRLLSHYVRGIGLGDLGLSVKDQRILEKASLRPFGMILVVGPTGSGKSTTLYAILKKLNNRSVNITTIEDPVEYKIKGVSQIQVNPNTNLTFAKGLRSMVRQDPDIIMVGEIRDSETAEIAINSALTGHLLLSTFHANDAAASIPRLMDMGVEPFLLASTIEIIVAQRLTRRLCEKCRYSEIAKKEYLAKFPKEVGKYFSGKNRTIFKAKGCPVCNGTGYKGRIGLFEVIVSTPELKTLLAKNPSVHEIWSLCSKQGSHTLFEDGLEKVANGFTSLEEVMRVAPPLQ